MAATERLPSTVPPDEQAQIRRLLDSHNERQLAAVLGISRQTLGRALAGLPLHHATVFLIVARLRALSVTPGHALAL